MSEIVKEFFDFLEYLEANDLKLNENGEVVSKEDPSPGLVLERKNYEE